MKNFGKLFRRHFWRHSGGSSLRSQIRGSESIGSPENWGVRVAILIYLWDGNPPFGEGVKDKNVADFRYALVESDDVPIEKQRGVYEELELPIAALVHSGNKSLHAIVRIDATDKAEHDKRVALLYEVCEKNGLKIDSQNRNPSRLSRLPGVERKGKKQFLVATNIGKSSWAEWESWLKESPDAKPWPEIVSFDVLDLPVFPTHVLPDVLRNWVEAESHSTQTPAELAALLALSVCAAMIARRVEVEPRPGWRAPVNLLVAALLEPGNRKSAVFSDAIQPLRDLESEDCEDAKPIVAKRQSERRRSETRLKRLEKIAAEKGDAEAAHEADELAVELAQQPEAVLPVRRVDDVTEERLVMVMAAQDGRIVSASPEGGVFDLMKGRYAKNGGTQFNVYLMGHAGDDLVVDRVSRGSIRVERPSLTCAFAVQPIVIKGLASEPAFRGRGLLARFIYAFPRSSIGRRRIASRFGTHEARLPVGDSDAGRDRGRTHPAARSRRPRPVPGVGD